ncbi:MAG: YggS family pyridoxal phosphate-dependent enzyme [Bacteroidales bacterium]|nr:YggS family pyridoxal phosphate-dependent enzyme [Bacteroidales bacterium]
MSITSNYRQILKNIPNNITLVAVSKTKPVEEIKELYDAGHKIFGENKVQELIQKYNSLPKDIEWHMVGHLQRNKVKYIAPFVHMIHGVDSFKLLTEIDKQAEKNNRKQKCLLQVHIAQEETKFGFSHDELTEALTSGEINTLKHVEICGLMGMASFTENTEQIRAEFRFLSNYFHTLKEKYFKNSITFKELSMGMSDDYAIAIEEGSTMVRIGSSIFGQRYYPNCTNE